VLEILAIRERPLKCLIERPMHSQLPCPARIVRKPCSYSLRICWYSSTLVLRSVSVLVHVLVHVRTWILFWLVHQRAILADGLCVASKGDVRIIARVCRTMQCVVKWTHNPLVGGSNPSGPTIEPTVGSLSMLSSQDCRVRIPIDSSCLRVSMARSTAFARTFAFDPPMSLIVPVRAPELCRAQPRL